MAKTPKDHGKAWTPAQVRQLRAEAAHNTPTRVLALHLDRTPGAVQAKASDIGLSLKPVNQRPYGTKKR